MSGEQFLYASIAAGVLTCLVLLWGLGAVVRRSSRLVALQVLGATIGGVLVLLLFARVAVGFLGTA